MQKLLLSFLIIFSISSCSEVTAPEPTIENDSQVLQNRFEKLILDYCNASNEKAANVIPDLLYPPLFEKMNKKEVEYMFYAQLNTTKKFEISNVQFDEPALVLEGSKEHKVFGQKYSSNISMELDSLASVGFDALAKAAMKADKNAKVDRDNYTIDYQEKRKLMLVQTPDSVYILPDVFLTMLENPKFNQELVLASYKAIP